MVPNQKKTMVKITLAELELLDKELSQLFENKLDFPLKFRLETKLMPLVVKGIKLLDAKKKELALANGAQDTGMGYSFETDQEGNIKENQKEPFKKFAEQVVAYMEDAANDIELDVTFNLSTLRDLKDNSRYYVFSKFVVDDIEA